MNKIGRMVKIPLIDMWPREKVLELKPNPSGVINCDHCGVEVISEFINMVDFWERVACRFCFEQYWEEATQTYKEVKLND